MNLLSESLNIGNKTESYYLRPSDIAFIRADGNYSDFHLVNGDTIEGIPLQLCEVRRRLSLLAQKKIMFSAVGRSLVVNILHIVRINPTRQILQLDILDPVTHRRMVLNPSVKALQELRHGLDTGQIRTLAPASITNGFGAHIRESQADEMSDDESLFF